MIGLPISVSGNSGKNRMRHLILLSLLLAVLASCSPCGDWRESSGEKREWSVLQGHEAEARQSVVKEPRFVQHDDYALLVTPNNSNTENIWIMLAPKSPPFYKQMPRGNYTIPCDVWEKIKSQHMASSTVEEVIASHVAEECFSVR